MYEIDLQFDYDSEVATPSDSEFYEDNNLQEVNIDYDRIEQAFYNALESYKEDNTSSESFDSDLVEFSSSTDARYITVGLAAEPKSIAQQQTAYLLDVRNILLIFLLIWFVFNSYHKLKTLLTNYYSK